MKKNHGEAISKFEELQNRFKKYGMFIKAWGLLAVAKDDDPYGHSGYIINNKDSIEEIESFLEGYEFGREDATKLEAINAELAETIERHIEFLGDIPTISDDELFLHAEGLKQEAIETLANVRRKS